MLQETKGKVSPGDKLATEHRSEPNYHLGREIIWRRLVAPAVPIHRYQCRHVDETAAILRPRRRDNDIYITGCDQWLNCLLGRRGALLHSQWSISLKTFVFASHRFNPYFINL